MNTLSFSNFPLLLTIAFSALLIGMSKMGLPGLNIVSIPLLIFFVDIPTALAISMPLLLVGDILACILLRKDLETKVFLRFVPWALVGVVSAGIFLRYIPRTVLVWILLGFLIYFFSNMLLSQWASMFGKPQAYDEKTPAAREKIKTQHNRILTALYGTSSGIATVVANASGPLTSLYLLNLGIEKKRFIGTGAYVFLMYNIIKVIFFVFLWKTVTPQTLVLGTPFIPIVILGLLLARRIVRNISERIFKRTIFILVFISITAIVGKIV